MSRLFCRFEALGLMMDSNRTVFANGSTSKTYKYNRTLDRIQVEGTNLGTIFMDFNEFILQMNDAYFEEVLEEPKLEKKVYEVWDDRYEEPEKAYCPHDVEIGLECIQCINGFARKKKIEEAPEYIDIEVECKFLSLVVGYSTGGYWHIGAVIGQYIERHDTRYFATVYVYGSEGIALTASTPTWSFGGKETFASHVRFVREDLLGGIPK